MEFKMVQHASVDTIVNESVVLIPSHVLLPFKIDKRRCRIQGFCPTSSLFEQLSNQSLIVPFANVILNWEISTVYLVKGLMGSNFSAEVRIDLDWQSNLIE